jgi:hypothetical protein
MKYSCFGDLHIFDGWFMVFNATFNNIAVHDIVMCFEYAAEVELFQKYVHHQSRNISLVHN